MTSVPASVGLVFHPPSTEDFLFDYLVGPWKVFGFEFGINYVMILLLVAILAFFALFYIAFRKPKIVPGKFQVLMEAGVEFVRNQVVMQMIGPQGLPFLPLLATFFFFIFLGNILEVIPFVSFPVNSRLAFPLVMALVAWVTYNAVGIRRHGVLGYLKLVMFPPGLPPNFFGRFILRPFLAVLEFFSVIIVRPITLTIRLTANMMAGHFLLAVFFLGSLVLFTGVPYVVGLLSFGLAVLLVGFEIFVAALQAFIFAVLTASYIAGAMAEEH